MKSAKSWSTKLCKAIRINSSNFVEAVSTGLCSFAAFGSLYLFEGGNGWVCRVFRSGVSGYMGYGHRKR